MADLLNNPCSTTLPWHCIMRNNKQCINSFLALQLLSGSSSGIIVYWNPISGISFAQFSVCFIVCVYSRMWEFCFKGNELESNLYTWCLHSGFKRRTRKPAMHEDQITSHCYSFNALAWTQEIWVSVYESWLLHFLCHQPDREQRVIDKAANKCFTCGRCTQMHPDIPMRIFHPSLFHPSMDCDDDHISQLFMDESLSLNVVILFQGLEQCKVWLEYTTT